MEAIICGLMAFGMLGGFGVALMVLMKHLVKN